MKKLFLMVAFAGFLFSKAAAQTKVPEWHNLNRESPSNRTQIILPQVKGFNVYKGDFHVHTSYSDGLLSPGGCVVDAWLDGLDILALTDHYEGPRGLQWAFRVGTAYGEQMETMYKDAKDAGRVMTDCNAIHNEAVMRLEREGYPMLLVKGCEMARKNSTHGHFNCLFLDDINDLYDPDMAVALRKVKEQGGIVVHNHPCWRRENNDKTPFHEQVYGEGLVDGVEVVNGTMFYPPIVRRCIDENLAMFANTDLHNISYEGYASRGTHRTMTLVLAKELTEKAIKDAILKRRTIGYAAGNLIGEESWLSELLNAAVDCRVVSIDEKKGTRTFQLINMSSISYTLRIRGRFYILEPFKTNMVVLGKEKGSEQFTAPKFPVENMWIADHKHPVIELEIDK